LSKIQSLPSNQSFGEISVKNPHFGQKSKFWSIIQSLPSNQNFGEISLKNPNFGQ